MLELPKSMLNPSVVKVLTPKVFGIVLTDALFLSLDILIPIKVLALHEEEHLLEI